MHTRPYSLAIETSAPQGSITLGRDTCLLTTANLTQPRRHNVELAPAIDEIFKRNGATAQDVGEVYVSIGPGSFTGLRIAVATAKMLGYALGAQLVAVPTLRVVVENAPTDLPPKSYVGVFLNTKRLDNHITGYASVYHRCDNGWRSDLGPALMSPTELCNHAPRPLAILADLPASEWPADIDALDTNLARPQSEAVWRVGHAMARQGLFTDPFKLTPLYARRPAAEELWEQKESG